MKLMQVVWVVVILALVSGCQKKEKAEQAVATVEPTESHP